MRKKNCAVLLVLLLAGSLRAQEPLTAEFDVRNRFVAGDRGSVYRSIVNLGEGPRLFNGVLRFEGKDRVDLNILNWGGDPNSTIGLEVRRDKVYELTMRYQTMAYFNDLPSFANPLLAQGVLASQRAIDLRRRNLDLELQYRPRARFTPFVGLLRTSGHGRGVTPFVGGGDEFPVPTAFEDTLSTVRGGGHFSEGRWSGTLEQGYTTHSDQQNLNSGPNGGNRATDTIVLDRLTQRYRATGSGWFSRAVLQLRPFDNLAFAGHFIHSRPKLEAAYEMEAEGIFRDPNTLRAQTGLLEQSLADARQPRTSASWSTEFRPQARWRMRHTWFSDTFRISGASPTAGLLEAVRSGRTRLNLQYNQSEAEISGELGKMLALRAGHRYVHGGVDLPPPDLVFPTAGKDVRLSRHIALAGATLNLLRGRGRLNASFEGSPGGDTYFRTGLQEYRKLALHGQVRLTGTLQISGSWRRLSNQNVGINFRHQQSTVSAEWSPSKARRATVVGSWSRDSLESESPFLDPTFFRPDISRYVDRGHHGNVYVHSGLIRGATLYAGAAVSRSEGTRPTHYYVPQARIVMPATERLSFVTEWHWYSYRAFEAFRAHTASVGMQVRLNRPR